MANQVALAELIERRNNYVDIQKRVIQSMDALGLSLKDGYALLPVCCPDLGVKSSILMLAKSAPSKAIFTYFSRKIRNFNPNKFELYLETVMLVSVTDGLPIRFALAPILLTSRIKDLGKGLIIMKEKRFVDDVLEDAQTLANQHEKLLLIKRLDTATESPKNISYCDNFVGLYEVIPIYKAFPVALWLEIQLTWTPAVLGIDSQWIYLVEDSPTHPEVSSHKPVVRKLLPYMAIASVDSCSLEARLLEIRAKDPGGGSTSKISIESDAARQIYNKLDFILRKLRGYPAPAG